MKQGSYTIAHNTQIADRTWRMRLEGDTSAFVRAGQFADIALGGYFLRRPFAATAWDKNGFDIIFKTVGKGTEELSMKRKGEVLDVITGLGNGFDPDKCKEKALIVCGGIGASPVFSLAAELIGKGRDTTVIMGFGKASEIILSEEYAALGARVEIATMDGSCGTEGLVTDAISALKPDFDFFYCCGPKIMMKAVCASIGKPGEVSLEERMGCGCGICYGCTCHTLKGPKRICADGPVFNKEDIIW